MTPPFYLLRDQSNQGPLFVVVVVVAIVVVVVVLVWGHPSRAQDQFKVRLLLGCHGLEADTARFRNKRKDDLQAGSSMIHLQALHERQRGPHPLCGYMPRPRSEKTGKFAPALALKLKSLIPDPARDLIKFC